MMTVPTMTGCDRRISPDVDGAAHPGNPVCCIAASVVSMPYTDDRLSRCGREAHRTSGDAAKHRSVLASPHAIPVANKPGAVEHAKGTVRLSDRRHYRRSMSAIRRSQPARPAQGSALARGNASSEIQLHRVRCGSTASPNLARKRCARRIA